MAETYSSIKIENRDFKIETLAYGEYEDSLFSNCNIYEADLTGYIFDNCSFNGCNLSMTKLSKTAFRNVSFKDCKMLGMKFENCNPFGMAFGFENCQLNMSSFFQTKIMKTVFKNCALQEADFTECNLTGAIFANCDFINAVFDRTILEKADFRTARNYRIDPQKNKIKKAKFSVDGISGLLECFDIIIE